MKHSSKLSITDLAELYKLGTLVHYNYRLQGIRINQLRLLSKDERGGTYAVFSRATSEFLLAYRKAGSISGKHWQR